MIYRYKILIINIILISNINILPAYALKYVNGMVNCVDSSVTDCVNSDKIHSYTSSTCPNGYIACRKNKNIINKAKVNKDEDLSYEDINQNIHNGETIADEMRKQEASAPKIEEKEPEKKHITVNQDPRIEERWREQQARERKEWELRQPGPHGYNP